MKKPLLQFQQILHNEPIYWLEQQWGRQLNDHEKHIVGQIYDWCRTNIEAEEVKFIEDLLPKGEME